MGEGTSEGGDGAELGGGDRAASALVAGGAVGLTGIDEGRVHGAVEEDDLAGDFFSAEGFDLGEGFDLDDFGGDAAGGGGDGVAEGESGERGRGAGGREQADGLGGAAFPVGDHHVLREDAVHAEGGESFPAPDDGAFERL